MDDQFPVPSSELVTYLRNSAPHGIRDAGVTREIWLINHAFTAGADQELDACCEWLPTDLEIDGQTLRSMRRPKPPSLKEQALEALKHAPGPDYPNPITLLTADEHALIRRALEALDD